MKIPRQAQTTPAAPKPCKYEVKILFHGRETLSLFKLVLCYSNKRIFSWGYFHALSAFTKADIEYNSNGEGCSSKVQRDA